MSWVLVSKVQKTKVGSPSAKSLLLALANFADDNGERCFPGQNALREITELSLDTIQRQLKYLIERGFVAALKERRGGRWESWVYRINLSTLSGTAAIGGSRDQAASCGLDGTGQAAPCGMDRTAACGTAMPHPAAPPGRRVRLYPSSHPSKEPERKPAPATQIPDDFRLDEQTYAWAIERLGGDRDRVERSVRRFADHARHKGSVSHDWMAKARTWFDYEVDRRQEAHSLPLPLLAFKQIQR
ncbi:hypothetical protein AYJ54_02730 [Bradyrhizobium centrolobii]|uniref:Helix-turn-helix domain-containing protein n=1 Tax=Bradyrhizobium centrolobii TaxID=1505087 RepID=A0A176YI09_9BRAD|nr:helix-turn-helix domain-containing protein [Bradyrhizobium centrolobii]OAF05820.1 hypothetical protein AYJ54_02730 [Bradyrhizobium centrolobii]